jgi:hypothetical protein
MFRDLHTQLTTIWRDIFKDSLNYTTYMKYLSLNNRIEQFSKKLTEDRSDSQSNISIEKAEFHYTVLLYSYEHVDAGKMYLLNSIKFKNQTTRKYITVQIKNRTIVKYVKYSVALNVSMVGPFDRTILNGRFVRKVIN